MIKKYLFVIVLACFSFSVSSSDSSGEDEVPVTNNTPKALRYFVVFADDSKNFDMGEAVELVSRIMCNKYDYKTWKSSLPEQISWVAQELKRVDVSCIERGNSIHPFRTIFGDATFSNNYFPIQLNLGEQALENAPHLFNNLSAPLDFRKPALFMLIRSSAKIKTPFHQGENRYQWLDRELLNGRYNPFINPRDSSNDNLVIEQAILVDLNARSNK